MTSPLRTPADLADWFGVTELTILAWRRTKRWPSLKVGRTIRFTPEQFDQIVAQHTVTPTAATSPAVVIDGQTARSANRRAS